jgi:hypothetical protein
MRRERGRKMAGIKTKKTEENVLEFIHAFSDTEKKAQDALALLALMEEFTGWKAKMWGSSMIGLGQYHYKSDRSKQEGDWPILGFSPRKAAISLYVYFGGEDQDALLEKLGKFKMGKACIYVKKLEDIDLSVLKELMASTMRKVEEKYPVVKA